MKSLSRCRTHPTKTTVYAIVIMGGKTTVYALIIMGGDVSLVAPDEEQSRVRERYLGRVDK